MSGDDLDVVQGLNLLIFQSDKFICGLFTLPPVAAEKDCLPIYERGPIELNAC